jgi:hypothetical protein
MNMVDDATGETLGRLDEQETTAGAMKLLWSWIDKYGIPAALYTDRKNVYVPDEKAAAKAELSGKEALTQFGRACKSLGIRIIQAHSPQAKGRVERSNGTYQDRLIKELRLEQINDIDSANKLLVESFADNLNQKFAVTPRGKGDFHRSAKGRDLASVFCIEEERSMTDDWIVRYGNSYYQMARQSKQPPTTKKVKVRSYLTASCTSITEARTWCTQSFQKGPCRQKRKHQLEASLGTFRHQLQITPGVALPGLSCYAASSESKRLQSDSYEMAVAQRGKLWKLPRVWKSGKTNCMFSHFPTRAWKTRRKKAATSFPQFPQLLLLVLLPKKEKKECDISNELKHVTFLKSFDKNLLVALTSA